MVMRIFFRRNEKDFKQVCLFVSYEILLHLIEKDFAQCLKYSSGKGESSGQKKIGEKYIWATLKDKHVICKKQAK